MRPAARERIPRREGQAHILHVNTNHTARDMEHAFATRRIVRVQLEEAKALASDVLSILTICPDDHARLLARRDVEIADVQVRQAVIRRAAGIGVLASQLLELCSSCTASADVKTNEHLWSSFVLGSKVSVQPFRSSVEALLGQVSQHLAEVSAIEDDDASSSYSDYSDSETASTDDERPVAEGSSLVGEEEESEEGEESEEEESEEGEDTPSPPARRRRRL